MFSLPNLAIQIIAGGFVGFITNTFAINMLFKEYTRFKFGGVIKKTKDEFIVNISQLVEDSIITHETVHKEFSKDTFRETIKIVLDDILEKSLDKTLGDVKLGEMPAFDAFVKNVKQNFEPDIDQGIQDILGALLGLTNFKDTISTENLSNLIEAVSKRASQTIEHTDIFETIMHSIINHMQEVKGSTLLNERVIDTIKSKLNEFLNIQNNNYTQQHRDYLISNINVIFDALNIETLILTEYERALDINLKNLLFNPKEHHAKQYIDVKIDNLLNSNDVERLLSDLIDAFIMYLSKMDKTIFDVVSLTFDDRLEKFMSKLLPILFSEAALFIKKYSAELDGIIIDTLDQSIESSTGFRSYLVKLIKKSLLDYLKNKSAPTKVIIEILEAQDEAEIKRLSDKIIAFVKHRKISEIAKILVDNKSIDSDKIARYILKYISKILKKLPTDGSDKFTNKTIKVYMSQEVDQKIRRWIENSARSFIMDLLVKASNLNRLTTSLINTLTQHLENASLKAFCTSHEASITAYLKSEALNQLRNCDANRSNWAAGQLKKTFDDKPLDALIPKDVILTIGNTFNNLAKDHIGNTLDTLSTYEVKNAKSLTHKVDHLTGKMSRYLHVLIGDHLEKIMQGNVKNLVKDNLNKYSADEICDLVHGFMGKELKPITRLGALFGGLVGIIPGLFQSVGSFDPRMIIMNVIIFAFVGWFTNVLAIEMLFKPYTRNKILGNIPYFKRFSVGFIIKNKQDFAVNMAHFVKNDLLDVDGIEEKLEVFYSSYKAILIERSREDGIKYVLDFLEKNKTEHIHWMKEKLLLSLNQKKAEIATKIMAVIDNYKFGDDLIVSMSDLVVKAVVDNTDKINDAINDLLFELTTTHRLNDFIVKQMADWDISTFGEIGAAQMMDRLKKDIKVDELVVAFYNKNRDKRLSDLIGPTISDQVVSPIIDYLLSKENLEKIYSAVTSFFQTEFNKDQTIDQAWHGAIKKYGDRLISEFFTSSNESLVKFIDNHKKEFSIFVNQKILDDLSIFKKWGYNVLNLNHLVENTVNDLVKGPVPEFIDKTRNDLESLVFNLVEKSVYSVKISKIDNFIEKTGFDSIITTFIDKEDEHSTVKKSLVNILGTIADELGKVHLFTVAEIFDLDSKQKMKARFEQKFLYAKKVMTDVFDKEQKKLKKQVGELIHHYLFDVKVHCSDSKVLIFNKTEAHKNDLHHLVGATGFYDKMHHIVRDNTYKALSAFAYNQSVAELIGNDRLDAVLSDGLENILAKEDFDDSLEEFIGMYYSVLLEKFLDTVPDAFINASLSYLTDAAFVSIKPNMDKILSDINFDRITEKAINNMSGKEIHKLFYDFAGRYFKKLKLYGVYGGFFGINSLLGIIVGIPFVAYEALSGKRKKK
ncbi:DUF445 family protein [Fusibacter sp. 3D3]|uniref:DUF445 family protein n=1 Tax=Fusibacter sp. 3D3 TaxID=1048380 RepID=UPI0008531346|nr:DUF445 family protein [Fusibacter sp. 3D3]GAU79541.1 hypothetical protein F3D3_4205 [Fusibacter sp. 3D3]